METKKVTVKIATQDTVKRVPRAETYAQLIETAKVLSKSPAVKLTYKDEEEDIIYISDDDDLFSAYDWASNQPGATLRVVVEAIEATKEEAKVESSEDESSSDDEDKMKEAVRLMARQSVASVVTDQISTERTADTNAYPQLDEIDKEDPQIDTCVNTQPKIQEKPVKVQAQPEPDIIDSQFPHVHENVECDGCGIAPIIGPRYKCSVLKDFDWCSNCEASKNHPHAFIKINKPEQAPKAIFTVINEDVPAQADQDLNINPELQKEWDKQQAWGRVNPCHAQKPGVQEMQMGMHPCMMKKKIGWFMKNLFGKQMGEPAQQAFAEAKKEGRKNPRRAVIVTQPGNIFAAWAGDTVELEFTFKNATKWAYPKGFHLESCYTDETKLLLEGVKVPVPEVKAGENFTIKVTVKVFDNVLPCKSAYRDFINAEFGITNSHGDAVGMKASAKVTVVQKIDELALYDKVMQVMGEAQTLVEGVTGEPFSFDKAVNALKMAHYDVKRAHEIIAEDLKKSGTVVNNDDLDCEEDLYN